MMVSPDPLTGAVLLNAREAARLLDEVLDRARGGAPETIVVFDLDSTLLDNRPRQALIMREYGEAAGLEALTRAGPEHWDGWDFRVAMRNLGLDESSILEHFDGFKSYWRERFFTSAYCRIDRPIAGAPSYARAVAGTGCRLCYVTGRQESMREGTLESFRRGGFPHPDGDRVQLLMKPSLEQSDDVFKEQTFAALRRLGKTVAAFDNEPTHINGYRRAFPKAHAIHLATDHSLREVKIVDGIPSIRDFSSWEAK